MPIVTDPQQFNQEDLYVDLHPGLRRGTSRSANAPGCSRRIWRIRYTLQRARIPSRWSMPPVSKKCSTLAARRFSSISKGQVPKIRANTRQVYDQTQRNDGRERERRGMASEQRTRSRCNNIR